MSGSLYFTPPTDRTVKLDGPFEEGQTVQLYANYPNGNFTVSFYKQDGASWTKIGQVASNSSGNAYYPNYTITSGDQTIFAETSTDLETNTRTITGTATPQSTTATLDAPTNGGKNWTAHFTNPAVPGKATQLQIQRIYTHEVSDVDAVNPGDSKTKRVGEWKTIATSTQDANGNSTFTLASPYPYRVEHRYRAVSGTVKSCEHTNHATVTTTCQVFGLSPTTPKNSGLSAVYFNTNEGHAVDTRTRYFEGEFSMTADTQGEPQLRPRSR